MQFSVQFGSNKIFATNTGLIYRIKTDNGCLSEQQNGLPLGSEHRCREFVCEIKYQWGRLNHLFEKSYLFISKAKNLLIKTSLLILFQFGLLESGKRHFLTSREYAIKSVLGFTRFEAPDFYDNFFNLRFYGPSFTFIDRFMSVT